jgi:thiamine pyrophosphate-dependent acetolactate synthase large subunit-like protein
MKVNVGELIVDSLRKYSVDHSFGIVASSIAEILDLLPLAGIKYYGARHEQWAGHMADSYTRISGKTSLVLAQSGAGVTNLVTAAATALRAFSPIIIISGGAQSEEKGKGTYQELDHVRIMSPVTKFSSSIPNPSRAQEIIRKAIVIARTPPKGPVYIEVPRDLFYEIVDYDAERVEDVQATFSPKEEITTKFIELVNNSIKPIVLAGGGVIWSGASKLLEEFSSTFKVPVVSTYSHNDVMDNSNYLWLGSIGRAGSKAAMKVYSMSDLIIALGTRMDSFTFLPYYGFKYDNSNAKVIQVDIDPQIIMNKSKGLEMGVVSDIKEFLGGVMKYVKEKGVKINEREQWIRDCIKLREEWRRELESQGITGKIGGNGLYPTIEEVYRELRKHLSKEAIVILDVGASPSLAYTYLEFTSSPSLLTPNPVGGLGFSIPAAIGAKIASPKRDVLAILGDGAFTMELPSLITSIEYNTNIKVLVMDNSAWGSEKNYQKIYYDSRYVGSDIKNPDLAKIAEDIGFKASVVESKGQMSSYIEEMLKSRESHVLIVKVDPNWFPPPARIDVVKKPKRGLFNLT